MSKVDQGAVSGSTAVTRREFITRGPADALAGLLDIEYLPVDNAIPPLWHLVYLLEHPKQNDLGIDGHPVHGVPAPPGPGRRRMFAGGRFLLHTPLRFDEPATRRSEVTRTEVKPGRSGLLEFVTVRHEITQGGRLAVADEHDIVYRAGVSTVALTPPTSGSSVPPASLQFTTDPTLLFRFSALTYNAHRIHYDHRYATQQEGYPELVIHGPLQVLLMGELMRRAGVEFTGREFSYQLIAPAYGSQTLAASFTSDDSFLAAQIRDATGRVTATSSLGSVTVQE
jgi:3-methylfumaryl-CoA hydratase